MVQKKHGIFRAGVPDPCFPVPQSILIYNWISKYINHCQSLILASLYLSLSYIH